MGPVLAKSNSLRSSWHTGLLFSISETPQKSVGYELFFCLLLKTWELTWVVGQPDKCGSDWIGFLTWQRAPVTEVLLATTGLRANERKRFHWIRCAFPFTQIEIEVQVYISNYVASIVIQEGDYIFCPAVEMRRISLGSKTKTRCIIVEECWVDGCVNTRSICQPRYVFLRNSTWSRAAFRRCTGHKLASWIVATTSFATELPRKGPSIRFFITVGKYVVLAVDRGALTVVAKRSMSGAYATGSWI